MGGYALGGARDFFRALVTKVMVSVTATAVVWLMRAFLGLFR